MRWYYWVAIIIGGSWIFTILYEGHIKEKAFKYALSLSKDKGIANFGAVGSGVRWMTEVIANNPAVKVNVDIQQVTNIPNLVYHNLEQTPYPFDDKQFDVAFCSHILEHLDNWQGAVKEWMRIADNVVLVLPYPYLHGWLSPDHRQHFTNQDIAKMRELPNVFIYC